jgi:hypothetical protein
MRGVRCILVLLAGIIILASCGNASDGSGCVELKDFGGTLMVDIICGNPVTRPIYEWDVDKPAFSVEVSDAASEALIWRLLSASAQDSISPPLQHGQMPFNTTTQGSGDTLEVGVKYRVRVIRLEGGETGIQDFIVLGE